MVRDPDGCELSPRERAIVDYALKLTRTPGEMASGDLDPLRGAGLDDTAILFLADAVSYFAYVNRLADGLGIELEPGHWDPFFGPTPLPP